MLPCDTGRHHLVCRASHCRNTRVVLSSLLPLKVQRLGLSSHPEGTAPWEACLTGRCGNDWSLWMRFSSCTLPSAPDRALHPGLGETIGSGQELGCDFPWEPAACPLRGTSHEEGHIGPPSPHTQICTSWHAWCSQAGAVHRCNSSALPRAAGTKEVRVQGKHMCKKGMYTGEVCYACASEALAQRMCMC